MWNYWVLRIAAQAEPPQEWSNILSALSGYIDDDCIIRLRSLRLQFVARE